MPADLARMKPMGKVNRLARLGYIYMLCGKLDQGHRHLTAARIEFADVSPND